MTTTHPPPPGDRRFYTTWLVILMLALIAPLMWIAFSVAESGQRHVGIELGNPTLLLAGVTAIGLLIAIFAVAIKLDRIVNYIDPAQHRFQPLSSARGDSDRRLATYLALHPPRPWDAGCFQRLWDAVLPPAARWTMGLMLPLILTMLALVTALTQSVTRMDRLLDAGPVTVVQATVLSVKEGHDKNSGHYVAVGYRFQPADETTYRQSVSYAPRTALRFGDLAEVEYLPQDPDQNRLRGLHGTPMDPAAILWPASLIAAILVIGSGLFYWWQRRFIRRLCQEGLIVDATIAALRRGGRGAIFCKIGYRLLGVPHEKRLVAPVDSRLYATLHNRRQSGETIKVLAHPTQFRSAYLIEPHLTSRPLAPLH